MKRIYKQVAAAPLDDGYGVFLDGRPLRTPTGAATVVPTAALAGAIAEEWDRQQETVDLRAMPLTGLARAAIDRVANKRSEILDLTAAYAETDLVCHLADSPPPLVDRQRAAWQPLIDRLAARHDIRLTVVTGILPARQSEDAVGQVRAVIQGLDPFTLTAVHSLTQATGSVVIALALLDDDIDTPTAIEAAQIDETYQLATWGHDQEAEAARQAVADQITATAEFLRLVRIS